MLSKNIQRNANNILRRGARSSYLNRNNVANVNNTNGYITSKSNCNSHLLHGQGLKNYTDKNHLSKQKKCAYSGASSSLSHLSSNDGSMKNEEKIHTGTYMLCPRIEKSKAALSIQDYHHTHSSHYISSSQVPYHHTTNISQLANNYSHSNNHESYNIVRNNTETYGDDNNSHQILFASNEFYTTMHNILIRTNTPAETYTRIMANLSPLLSSSSTNHNHFQWNHNEEYSHHFNGNTNSSGRYQNSMIMNCRQFSSTSGSGSGTSTHSSQSDQKATLTTDDDKTTSSSDFTTKITPTDPMSSSSSSSPSSSSSLDNKPPPTLVKKDLTIQEKAKAMVSSLISSITTFLSKIPGILWFYITHPKDFKEKLIELKEAAKKEAHHYYMGSKLLIADVKTAKQMLVRLLNGSTLTRRERKQFIRTVTDVFRMVPMAIFVLIPFMEFALPFALKIFPNMLPSTFQDTLKNEENMKRELNSRIAMTEFFQETLQDLAKNQRKRAAKKKEIIKAGDQNSTELESTETREETAASFLEFIEKARKGEFLPPEVIIRYSAFFKDELTLDNMPRMQLINMCKYMSIPPYGNDNFLRFQLRHKVRILQEDDQRIVWEGIDSLTKMELREACQERGMRSTGLSKEAYKRSLQQWIDLSVNRNVPVALLIMSRTFFLREEMTSRASVDTDGSKSVAGLADAISGLDREVVNEVILESVSSDDKKRDLELMKLKLEVLEHQNELIQEETKQRLAEEAKKAELALEKEKQEQELIDGSVEKIEKLAAQDTAVDATLQEKEGRIEDSITFGSKEGSIDTIESNVSSTGESEVKEVGKQNVEKKEDDEEEKSLSSEEIDAISQLVSPDPVSKERQKLEKIKAAMQQESESKSDTSNKDAKGATLDGSPEKLSNFTDKEVENELFADVQDKKAAEEIAALDEKVKTESDASTVITMEGKTEKEPTVVTEEESDYGDEKLNIAIARLQSKVESMVGKIEIQLSDVEEKIGNKLHLLDKDMDGILSREEMALCLQSVLKRPLTLEEAMAIAADMDENEDGYFSMEELSKWLETNKIVKLVEEGNDAEVDKLIAQQSKKLNEEKQKDEQQPKE